MENSYQLQIPSMSGFDLRYYFDNSPEKDEARVFPPHVHDRLEFYALVEGNVSFMVENHLYRLQPGDVIVSKPNEIHNCILNTDSVHQHLCFWFEATSDFLFSDFLTHEMGKGNLISPTESDKGRLLTLYYEIRQAGEEDQKHRQLYLALEILDILRRNMEMQTESHSMPPLLREILDDVNENFVAIGGLSYFTEKYYVSSSTLNRLFQSHLHTTPKLYLEAKKLAYSRILLKEGKSVMDACVSAGFINCSNYIRLFKKRFHITPTEYKSGMGVMDMELSRIQSEGIQRIPQKDK